MFSSGGLPFGLVSHVCLNLWACAPVSLLKGVLSHFSSCVNPVPRNVAIVLVCCAVSLVPTLCEGMNHCASRRFGYGYE